MENLIIEATKSSPKIDFNQSSNTLLIHGESYPEDTTLFYEPVFSWLEEYLELLEEKAVVNIELIYFNSSSSRVLMDIFDMLEDASEEGRDITINWIYEEDNDASEEYGEEFADDIENVKFNLVVKK